jgi:hypothetical protein
MAIVLKFYGTEKSKTEKESLEVFCNAQNELTIITKDEDCEHCYNKQHICLDKATAIRLSRELRKQIALLV